MHSSRVLPIAAGVGVVALLATGVVVGPLGGVLSGPDDAGPRAADPTATQPARTPEGPGDGGGRAANVDTATDAPPETTAREPTRSPEPTPTDGYAVALQNGSSYDRGLTLLGEGPADATLQVRRVTEADGRAVLADVVTTDGRGRYRLDTTRFEPGRYRILTEEGDTVATFEVLATATAE